MFKKLFAAVVVLTALVNSASAYNYYYLAGGGDLYGGNTSGPWSSTYIGSTDHTYTFMTADVNAHLFGLGTDAYIHKFSSSDATDITTYSLTWNGNNISSVESPSWQFAGLIYDGTYFYIVADGGSNGSSLHLYRTSASSPGALTKVGDLDSAFSWSLGFGTAFGQYIDSMAVNGKVSVQDFSGSYGTIQVSGSNVGKGTVLNTSPVSGTVANKPISSFSGQEYGFSFSSGEVYTISSTGTYTNANHALSFVPTTFVFTPPTSF